MAKLSVQEKQGRAEDDARTLTRYQQIVSDKSRMSAANKALNKQIKEAEAGLKNLRKAAK